MLLRQMKFFIAVVEYQSFSEAAERCFISQSAVSQQIKALEETLETRLIERGGHHFSLTPAGEYFYKKAKKIVHDSESLKMQVKNIAKDKKKSFRIGWRHGYNIRRLFSVINQLLAENDRLNIDVCYGGHTELMEKLRNNEVDIIFNDVRNETENAAFCQQKLVDRAALIAVAARKPYTEMEYLRPNDLQGLNCILITNKDDMETEKSFYAQLYNFQGSFSIAENIPAAVTQVINTNCFMPNYFGNDAQEFFRSVTKLLPIKINDKLLKIKYCAFWNKESENKEFNKIKNELLKRLPHVPG